MQKRCGACKQWKNVDGFHKNKGTKDGLQSRCKPCHGAAVRKTPSQRPEARRERAKLRTPEQVQRASARSKVWYQRNPFDGRLDHMLQFARGHWRRAGLPVEKFTYQEVLARDGWFCYLCGDDVLECELSFDHVIPFSKRGPHSFENVRVAHIRCNDSKGVKSPTEQRWLGRGKSNSPRGCYRAECAVHGGVEA